MKIQKTLSYNAQKKKQIQQLKARKNTQLPTTLVFQLSKKKQKCIANHQVHDLHFKYHQSLFV